MKYAYSYSEYLVSLSLYRNNLPVYFTDSANARYDIESGLNIAWAIPDDEPSITPADIRDIQTKIRSFVFAYPDFTDSAWCQHNAESTIPYKWVGKYFATNMGRRLIGDSTLYDCPHCAYVDAKRIMSERSHNIRLISLFENTTIPSQFLPQPQPLEVNGEAVAYSTATINDGEMPGGLICSNCGFFGHTMASCVRPKKNFLKIGVELEGRYLRPSETKERAAARNADYSGDGSIRCSVDSDAEPLEFKTHPGNLRETIEQMMALYPDEADYSCGMHVHVSFPDHIMTLLNTKAFFAYFNKRWTDWGEKMGLHSGSEFYKRLKGENDYCYVNETEENNMVDMDRYHQLNFSAWAKCKTVECRLLPMFRRSSLAIAAVQELMSIYEDFLANPEAHGFTWPDLKPVMLSVAALNKKSSTETFELEIPTTQADKTDYTIELSELLPPAEGMMRIALPVNKAITLEVLAERLKQLKAA